MKLLCDQMLGTLTKWLRILGLDTYYATIEMTDDDILQIAKTEQRVLISRDKQLIQRAKKEQLPYIAIQTTNLDEQLKAVLNHVSFNESSILSRCTICNTVLESIEKHIVKDKVPPRIFEQHDTFWFCKSCGRVYWMGTHYEHMKNKLQKLKQMK
ncbi:MAG: Mut7-C RNAse domain-containing protein [Euryarchaeota archaeon]|nr:Mut7-C RNAse domain-containing protein [Euryarchaeota archaeon]